MSGDLKLFAEDILEVRLQRNHRPELRFERTCSIPAYNNGTQAGPVYGCLR